MDIEIKKLQPVRVISLRHIGPYVDCGQAWEQICRYAGPKGLIGPHTQMLGLSHDDPEVVSSDKLRYDACLTIEREVEVDEPFAVHEIKGGDYAVTIHKGPYVELGKTYGRICGEWLPQSKREPGPAPCVEVYINDPQSTPAHELVTEVRVPLA